MLLASWFLTFSRRGVWDPLCSELIECLGKSSPIRCFSVTLPLKILLMKCLFVLAPAQIITTLSFADAKMHTEYSILTEQYTVYYSILKGGHGNREMFASKKKNQWEGAFVDST